MAIKFASPYIYSGSSNLRLGATSEYYTHTGRGITFPSTQQASSDVNTLDDYEEGVYSPIARGRDSTGTGTYTRQDGSYTKIGRLVVTHIDIGWSAHTGTGGLEISLPFAVTASMYQAGGFVSFNGGLSYSSGYSIYGWSDSGGSYIRVWQSDNSGNALAVPMDTVVSELHFVYIYSTA